MLVTAKLIHIIGKVLARTTASPRNGAMILCIPITGSSALSKGTLFQGLSSMTQSSGVA